MDLVSSYSSKKSRKRDPSHPKSSQFTVDVKVEILQFLEFGGAPNEAATKYGVSVDTILEISEAKDQIYETRAKMMELASVREDKTVLALDEPLVKWVNSVKQYGLDVIGRDIQAQANQLAADQGLVGFNASEGWLSKFRQRNSRLFRADSNFRDPPDDELGSSDADEQAVRMAQLKKGKPRIRLNVSQKMDVIKYMSNGKNLTQTREFFGLPVSSICTIMKNRAKTEEAYAKKQHDRCLLRTEKAARLDEPLVKWIHDMRAYEIKLVGDDIRARALELAAEMGLSNFNASSGWLGRFRWRNRAALTADAGILEEEEPVVEERLVDEDHVPDWVKEIHRKNEKRRMSFPIQASAPLALENAPEEEDEYGCSDEENSRDVELDLSESMPLTSVASSPPKNLPPPQPRRPSYSPRQQPRQRRQQPPPPPPPSQQQQHRQLQNPPPPRRNRQRDAANPPPPPPPPPQRLLPPSLLTRQKRLSPVEDLEKSLIALEMDHIRRFSNLLRHHKLLLVVDDGEECRMSGDPGLQSELFGEEEGELSQYSSTEPAPVKTELPFEGEVEVELEEEQNDRGEASTGVPAMAPESLAGGKRKSGGKGAPASKKRKREEEQRRQEVEKAVKDKSSGGSRIEEGEVVGSFSEDIAPDEHSDDDDDDDDGGSVGELYGGSNGQESPPQSSFNYDSGSVFPPRPSDDHLERIPDDDVGGSSKHSLSRKWDRNQRSDFERDRVDSDSLIDAAVNGDSL